MNIQEATKKALKTGVTIRRAGWPTIHISIKPTNTPDCCLCYRDKKNPRRGWQPVAEDLIADDWIVT